MPVRIFQANAAKGRVLERAVVRDKEQAERGGNSRVPRVGAAHRCDGARYLGPVGVDEDPGEHGQDQNAGDLDVPNPARRGRFRLVRFLSRFGHTRSVALGGPGRKSQALYLRDHSRSAVGLGWPGIRVRGFPCFFVDCEEFPLSFGRAQLRHGTVQRGVESWASLQPPAASLPHYR